MSDSRMIRVYKEPISSTITRSLTRELLEEGRLRFRRILLLSEESFIYSITNPLRVNILRILAAKPLRASEIARVLGVHRALAHKHLIVLEENGWIKRSNGFYSLSSDVYLVYRVQLDERNTIKIEILDNKAAFVDHIYGLIIILDKNIIEPCGGCIHMETCDKKIYVLAKRMKISLESRTSPIDKIIALVNKYIRENIGRFSKSYMVLKR
ncbi:MAG: winged helix-turn-helix domain-containing protein [Sulfolobales archaeon]